MIYGIRFFEKTTVGRLGIPIRNKRASRTRTRFVGGEGGYTSKKIKIMAQCRYCKQKGVWKKVDGRWVLFVNNRPHRCEEYRTIGQCPKCGMRVKYKLGKLQPHICKPIRNTFVKRSKQEIILDKTRLNSIYAPDPNEDQIKKIMHNEPLL